VRADGQPVVGKSGWVHRGHSREERLRNAAEDRGNAKPPAPPARS
jgi:hypothetical protein